MALRTATMNPMSFSDTSPTAPGSDSLLRKLVLLLLLVSAAALWIVIWFRQETTFPLLLSTFFADASLGLIAGFGSRIVMRRQDVFLRYLVGILVAVLAMILIGFLTKSVLGVGPIMLEKNLAAQVQEIRFDRDLGTQFTLLHIGSRTLFDFSKLDWADFIHLVISLLMTMLSLQAWRRVSPEPEPVEIAPLPVVELDLPPAPRPRRSRKSAASANGRARVRRADNSPRQLTLSPHPQPRVRSNNGTRSTAGPRVRKMKEPTVRPKKKRISHRRPKIQFALVEEHRCPYCLDAVTHNDPRGVKECEVCHTLHHADCWAITGICQVPHLNT